MAIIKLPVQLQHGGVHPDDLITIGEGFLKKLKAPTNQTVFLRCGSIRKEVRILRSSQASLRMNNGMAARLGIRSGTKVCVSYHASSRTLRLGPLIGVLVSRVYSHTPDRPFGAMTAFCVELTEACAQHGGVVFFFTPEDISGGSTSINGWSLASGRWTKGGYPVPDVLYNRLTSRKLENRPNVQQFMRDIKIHYSAVVFNEKYLDKTEVFQALRKDRTVQSYLPESYLFKNFAMLKTMCKKHSTVFLKPITGSLGKGIIKITVQPEGGYLCSLTSLNGVKRQTYPTLTRLFQSISGKMKQRRYQIQQGLRLMEAGGRPVDFRALVQRNMQGQWAVTSVVARIAASNTFVSNLARGGTLSPVNEAVAKSSLSSGTKSTINSKLRTAALDIAKSVEANIEGHFAELGVDLAVDASGHVWLLEVNSKPSKDDNTPSGDSKIRPSVKQIVLYSQHAWSK